MLEIVEVYPSVHAAVRRHRRICFVLVTLFIGHTG